MTAFVSFIFNVRCPAQMPAIDTCFPTAGMGDFVQGGRRRAMYSLANNAVSFSKLTIVPNIDVTITANRERPDETVVGLMHENDLVEVDFVRVAMLTHASPSFFRAKKKGEPAGGGLGPAQIQQSWANVPAFPGERGGQSPSTQGGEALKGSGRQLTQPGEDGCDHVAQTREDGQRIGKSGRAASVQRESTANGCARPNSDETIGSADRAKVPTLRGLK